MSPAAVKMDDSKGGAAMEARFADFCKTGLALDESTARQAMDLFKETNHILLDNMMAIDTGSPAEMELLLFAFVLYCVVRLGQGRDKLEQSGVSLPQILKATKLKSRDFFKEIPQFSIQAGFVLTSLYGSDWEKRLGLKELQASIMHLSLLRRHYKRSYHKFFLTSETSSNQHSSVCGSAEYISDYHRFGWLLFLALRVHDFGRFEDLVTCTNGLVSIMAILILHVPICFRNFSIQDSPSFARKSGKGIDLLASLSEIYDTSEDELRRTMAKVNKLIINLLEKKPCPASECKKESLDHVDPDGLTYFDNLLEGNSLQSCLLILENDYDYAIRNKGEVDECLLIDDESSLLSPESLSGGALNITGTKRKFDEIASPTKRITSSLSPPCSPVNGNLVSNSRVPATTPVSTAMTTAKWLRTVISPLPSKPSVELERFLSSCDKNVTSDVTRRAYIILEAIFSSSYFGERCISGCWESMSLTESTWAEQRKMEALKLYYRVLEAICRAESHRLHGNNLTSLLTSEQFHRCMLACSAELVLATYKTITLTFPVVLEKSGITAFDLSKVIESFIRHEETLPRELKRHLNFLEERLLESMVWEKGSSMYNSLIVARPALSGEINRLGLLAEPLPSLDAIAMHHNIHTAGLPPLPFQKRDTSSDQNGDAQSPQKVRGEHRTVLVEHNLFRSPIKERLLTFNSLKSKTPPLQSAFATPTRQNPAGGETCAETGINVFISKILKLAAQRVRGLCERLKLSQQTLDCVYCLIKQILGHRISIFFNRHIDQIIICCFYGIVKIHQLSLTFKDIIYTYKTQPQCKSQVYQSVFVSCPPTSRNRRTGQEHVTIINFYNAVFVPGVKDLLLELGPSQKSRGHDDNKNNDDGQIPGSPRLPPFPYLPDMSPKKVSASHNVFVSPIRSSSKMDALLSPSSRSYYACVGESTLAYQSPSADLSVINKHLSCSRKIGGKLNFDLVSDAVVARSFGQQNGSSVSSVATTVNNPPMKQEQPDSQ